MGKWLLQGTAKESNHSYDILRSISYGHYSQMKVQFLRRSQAKTKQNNSNNNNTSKTMLIFSLDAFLIFHCENITTLFCLTRP